MNRLMVGMVTNGVQQKLSISKTFPQISFKWFIFVVLQSEHRKQMET